MSVIRLVLQRSFRSRRQHFRTAMACSRGTGFWRGCCCAVASSVGSSLLARLSLESRRIKLRFARPGKRRDWTSKPFGRLGSVCTPSPGDSCPTQHAKLCPVRRMWQTQRNSPSWHGAHTPRFLDTCRTACSSRFRNTWMKPCLSSAEQLAARASEGGTPPMADDLGVALDLRRSFEEPALTLRARTQLP